MTNRTPPPQRRVATRVPVFFALGLVLLAVVVTATWAITWTVVDDDSTTAKPAENSQVPPASDVVDTVRATTESLYNFTPDTISATVKTAQATLCDEALAQWNETVTSLTDIVAETGRSVTTSNAHYGLVREDAQAATVLAVFQFSASEANSTPAAPETTAIEFTVDRTAVPMCITTMKVL